MPDDQASQGEVVQNNTKPNNETPSHPGQISEAFQAQLLQIYGNQGGGYRPTRQQVDKILALQEKGMDYTHKERMNVTAKQKVDMFLFGGVVVALIVIILIVAWKAPDQIGLAITGAIAFLTGGAGGYSIGKSKKKADDD
jgi:hypothetical protein